MKKISSIAFALVFAVTALISVGSFVQGDTATANELGAIALVSLAGGSALHLGSSVLGLQWTRTEETLLNHLASKSEPDVFNKFNKGQLRFRDYVIYRSILIDGFSGIQKVWDSTVAKAIGITNVDRAKLDKDVHICVDSILLEYVNSGGAGTDPAAVAGYDSVVTAWPAQLVNGEITILQDGNPLLEDHPTSTCGSAQDSFFAKGAADAYKLKTPFVLEGDKNFEVRINFAGAVAAANTDFIKVSLFGVGTRKRGQL